MHENTTGRPERDPFDALVDVLAAADRYDLALGIIPIAFVIALVTANAFGIAVPYALVGAAIVGVGIIVDVCYLNPPIDQGSTGGPDERSFAN